MTYRRSLLIGLKNVLRFMAFPSSRPQNMARIGQRPLRLNSPLTSCQLTNSVNWSQSSSTPRDENLSAVHTAHGLCNRLYLKFTSQICHLCPLSLQTDNGCSHCPRGAHDARSWRDMDTNILRAVPSGSLVCRSTSAPVC